MKKQIFVMCLMLAFSLNAQELTPIEQICADYCTTPEPDPAPRVKPNPSGNYVSASASTATSQAVDPALVSLDFVEGTLVRVSWSLVNTAEDVYDWSIIDRELQAAKDTDSFITIAIPDSKSMPVFILESCAQFDYLFRNGAVRTCLPWDTEYLRLKDKFVAAMGDRYDAEKNVSGVYISYAAMTNGVEMHWRVDEANFTAAGYNYAKLRSSYAAVFDSYASAFKRTAIMMEVHNVFDSPQLAIDSYQHCYNRIGERCGVAAWWCASRMATDSTQSEFEVAPVVLEAATKSFGVCQTIGNFTDQPDRFGSGLNSVQAAEQEMKYWKGQGIQYFELWPKDIKNTSLTAFF